MSIAQKIRPWLGAVFWSLQSYRRECLHAQHWSPFVRWPCLLHPYPRQLSRGSSQVVLVFSFCPSSSRCEVQLGWSPLVAKRTIHDDSKTCYSGKKTWKNIALITSDSRFLHFWSCSNLRKAFREVWRAKGLTSKGRWSTQSARLVQRRQTGKWEVSCRFQNNSKVSKAQNWDSGIPSTVYSGSKSEKAGSKRNQSH